MGHVEFLDSELPYIVGTFQVVMHLNGLLLKGFYCILFMDVLFGCSNLEADVNPFHCASIFTFFVKLINCCVFIPFVDT